MKYLNVAITSLELALEEVKKTENPKRIAEANNLRAMVWDAKERLNDGEPFIEIDAILNEVGKRVNLLMEDVNSAGQSDKV